MVTSKRAYTKGDLPGLLLPVALSGEPLMTHASAGDPPVLAGSFVSVSCGVTAPFLWVLVHTKFCLCPPRLESVSYSPVELLQSNPTGFQGHIPCGFPVPLLDPQAGKPDVGSKPSRQCEKLLWYYCSPVCGFPTLHVWGLILSRMHPSYHLAAASLSLDMEYLILMGPSLLLLMAIQQLVVILVLLEKETNTCLLHHLELEASRWILNHWSTREIHRQLLNEKYWENCVGNQLNN